MPKFKNFCSILFAKSLIHFTKKVQYLPNDILEFFLCPRRRWSINSLRSDRNHILTGSNSLQKILLDGNCWIIHILQANAFSPAYNFNKKGKKWEVLFENWISKNVIRLQISGFFSKWEICRKMKDHQIWRKIFTGQAKFRNLRAKSARLDQTRRKFWKRSRKFWDLMLKISMETWLFHKSAQWSYSESRLYVNING